MIFTQKNNNVKKAGGVTTVKHTHGASKFGEHIY